jgi:VIT1/CCC1 family predicted Fe2+/Mn2+ transporter
MSRSRHPERHRSSRATWLRAAVLGANDGIISTACLLLGLAAASADRNQLLLAGIAALVAGAMSMAAGEYVSVSSQADAEHADLQVERLELKEDPDAEHRELTAIYISRGVTPELASRVARQLMAHDALGAHAQDELGIRDESRARPLQAAAVSACSFSAGAALPLLTTLLASGMHIAVLIALTSLLFLVVLGSLAAYIGAAPISRAALRVGFWGVLAMAITTGVGKLFGAVI